VSDERTTDLVILGGGSGGYACALRAAELGLSVVLVEKDKLGGVLVVVLVRSCLGACGVLVLEVASAGTLAVRSRPSPSVGSNNLHAECSKPHRPASVCALQKLAAEVTLEAVDLGCERGLFEAQRRGGGRDGRVGRYFGESAKPFPSRAVVQCQA
jgi:hypothetical protein